MFRIILALCTCGGAGGALYFVTTPGGAVPGYVDPKARDINDDKKLPTNAEMEQLAKKAPVRFLENVIRRYNQQVKGYSLTMTKLERRQGELQKKELMLAHFSEEPHSVFLEWKKNAGLARRVVYVEGKNDDKMIVKSTAFGLVVIRDPEGSDARKSSRYTMKQFGLKKATLRTLAGWDQAAKDKSLDVEYLGKVKLREAGGQECWVLRRAKYKEPDPDGVSDLTIFISTQTWLQVGSILKDRDGKVVGEYYFWDIKLNPEFADDQFTRAALSK